MLFFIIFLDDPFTCVVHVIQIPYCLVYGHRWNINVSLTFQIGKSPEGSILDAPQHTEFEVIDLTVLRSLSLPS